MTTPLEELSHWAVGVDAIPPEARHAARRVLMDQVGVSLAGGATLDTLVPGEPAATLWSTGTRASAPDAALANRYAGDDLELTAGPEIGAAGVAAAEVMNATMGELYVAMAVASEIETYARRWLQKTVEAHGLHPPAVFGALAAAAAAAKVLRLDRKTFTGALAAAMALAPQSPYVAFSHGATGKWLYGAWSQRLGVQAALWSRVGIHGATTTLDGTRGIAQAFLHDTEDAPRFEPTGWSIAEVTFKAFPCSRACHPALSALQELGDLRGRAIAEVDIWSYPFSVELEARSNLQRHQSSIADQMSISAMVREALATEAPIRVHATGDDTLPRKREARVRVRLDDGSVLKNASGAKWAAHAPARDDELRERFTRAAGARPGFDPWDARDDVAIRELMPHG